MVLTIQNSKFKIHLTLTNLHRNEYSQVLHYYPFLFNLDTCVRICNTLNDLTNKVVCVQIK